MLSDFMVQHSECDLFNLDEEEWKAALREHPELAAEDDFLKFYPRSASAWIEPKKDCYFTNEVH